MADEPKPTSDSNPSSNSTTGRNAGFHLDEKGNVTGIWFTAQVDHFFEFKDEAIDLTPRAKDSDSPGA